MWGEPWEESFPWDLFQLKAYFPHWPLLHLSGFSLSALYHCSLFIVKGEGVHVFWLSNKDHEVRIGIHVHATSIKRLLSWLKKNSRLPIEFSAFAFCPAEITTSTGRGANDDQYSYLEPAISAWIPVTGCTCPISQVTC